MAECNFILTVPGAITNVVAKMKAGVAKQGGTFNGDTNSGTFSLKILGSNIQGSYSVNGSILDVSIDDKPFFVGCGQIESFLKGQLSS